jgi:myo-inositol 2-dehydrogenase/D-chiro-inositol 1-dehydrogenase
VDELVIVDTDRSRAQLVAAEVGAAVGGSIGELLISHPDCIVVATPTHTHARLVGRCCDLGIAVFCEKPVSMDLAEAEDLVDAVDASGVMVHVGFQRRFDAGYVAARETLQDGGIGELRRLHLLTADPAPPPRSYIAGSGGIYRDCQIHDFDVLRWVTGREVVQVFATGANRGDEHFGAVGDVDESVALLTLDDGTLATVQASRYNGAGYDVRMELAGTRGTIVAGLDERTPVVSTEPGAAPSPAAPWPGFLQRFAAAYRQEMAAFVTAVGEGLPSPCTVRDSLQAMLVAEAAGISRRERRPVWVQRAALVRAAAAAAATESVT